MDKVFLHTGSTLLNLALTGNAYKGWPSGRMSNIIGDKSSGKTLLAIEAATLFLLNPPAKIKPKVVYYEVEAAFDQAYAAQLGMPVDLVQFESGDTIEELYAVIKDTCEEASQNESILFIVDSLDALSSKDELDTDIEKGSYGMTKQKKLGELFRKLVRPMENANMHLFIISQIRENITTLPFAPKYRRSGGKALDFYASHLVWLAETGKLKTPKKMIYGIDVLAKVSKNKVARPFREVSFPIIFEFGIDEIYSLIKFLSQDIVDVKLRIKKLPAGYYQWGENKYRINDLVEYFETNKDEYITLVNRVQDAWDGIERDATISRKSKIGLLASPEETGLTKEHSKIAESEVEEDVETSKKISFRRRSS